MSVTVLFLLLFAVLVYWLWTQILPERQKESLIRTGLGEGLLQHINERRHELGLPLLELDDELSIVAEEKAVHQIMTGVDEEGWEYPDRFAPMLGRSLLMETLLTGPMTSMRERLLRQKDLFDGEWIACGIGVGGGKSGHVVVAIILCREAWEPVAEVTAKRQSFALE